MAYCYKITHKKTGKYYFGARWHKGCKSFKEDFFKKYFTSSKIVHRILMRDGVDSFDVECLLESDNVDDVVLLEYSLIVQNLDDDLMLNICYGRKPHSLEKGKKHVMIYSRRRSVAFHLRKIRGELKRWNVCRKNWVDRIYEMLHFLKNEDSERNYDRIFKFMKTIKCFSSEPPYNALISPDGQMVRCKTSDVGVLIDNGFTYGRILKRREKRGSRVGMYKGDKEVKVLKNEVEDFLSRGFSFGRPERVRKKISDFQRMHPQQTSDEVRQRLSELGKKKIYCTSPCLTKLRAVYKMEDVPPGWLLGNKLKERNKKISMNSRWRKHDEKSDQ